MNIRYLKDALVGATLGLLAGGTVSALVQLELLSKAVLP